MSAGHTELLVITSAEPWSVDCEDADYIAYQGISDGPSGVVAIAVTRIPGDTERTAGEIVTSVNSYRRHFGPRAIEAAEADLLGKALEALREAREALHFHYVEWDGEPEDAVPLQLARSKCDAILSQVREVRG